MRLMLTFLLLSVTATAMMCIATVFLHISPHFARSLRGSAETTEKEKQTIMDKITQINAKEKIYNEDKFGSLCYRDVVIAVQVHNRLIYLKELVASLSSAEGVKNVLLIFSHDVYNETINAVVRSITFCKVMQIFYPFSIQTHPDKFPGPDPPDYFNNNQTRRLPTKSQVKLHWWWKIHWIFYRMKKLRAHAGLVLFLEDDHYVAPDFFYVLKMMQLDADRNWASCGLFALGHETTFNFNKFDNSQQAYVIDFLVNLGLAMNRSVWDSFAEHYREFCTYDDYNWDWTLRYLVQEVVKPTTIMMISVSRVGHIGKCGIHHESAQCDPGEAVERLQRKWSKKNLFPKELLTRRYLHKLKLKKFGGWGDPRDHSLCMAMSYI